MFVDNKVFGGTEDLLIPELKRFLKESGLSEIACSAPYHTDRLIGILTQM